MRNRLGKCKVPGARGSHFVPLFISLKIKGNASFVLN